MDILDSNYSQLIYHLCLENLVREDDDIPSMIQKVNAFIDTLNADSALHPVEPLREDMILPLQENKELLKACFSGIMKTAKELGLLKQTRKRSLDDAAMPPPKRRHVNYYRHKLAKFVKAIKNNGIRVSVSRFKRGDPEVQLDPLWLPYFCSFYIAEIKINGQYDSIIGSMNEAKLFIEQSFITGKTFVFDKRISTKLHSGFAIFLYHIMRNKIFVGLRVPSFEHPIISQCDLICTIKSKRKLHLKYNGPPMMVHVVSDKLRESGKAVPPLYEFKITENGPGKWIVETVPMAIVNKRKKLLNLAFKSETVAKNDIHRHGYVFRITQGNRLLGYRTLKNFNLCNLEIKHFVLREDNVNCFVLGTNDHRWTSLCRRKLYSPNFSNDSDDDIEEDEEFEGKETRRHGACKCYRNSLTVCLLPKLHIFTEEKMCTQFIVDKRLDRNSVAVYMLSWGHVTKYILIENWDLITNEMKNDLHEFLPCFIEGGDKYPCKNILENTSARYHMIVDSGKIVGDTTRRTPIHASEWNLQLEIKQTMNDIIDQVIQRQSDDDVEAIYV